MAGTRLTGASLYVEFKGINISGNYRSFDPGLELEVVDTSAGGSTLRTYEKTLFNIQPTMTVIYDFGTSGTPLGTAILAVLKEDQTGTLIWAPEGTATGKPRWGILARVTTANASFTYDAEVEREIAFANLQSEFIYDGRTAVY